MRKPVLLVVGLWMGLLGSTVLAADGFPDPWSLLPVQATAPGGSPAPSGTAPAAPAIPPAGSPGGGGLPPNLAPEMLGDQGALPGAAGGPGMAAIPGGPGAAIGGTAGRAGTGAGTAPVVPRARGFKISENESPWPQTRVYLSFNYFDHFLSTVNRRAGTGIEGFRLFREHLGLERSFLDGDLSVGLRLPVTTTQTDRLNGPGSTHTVGGDLALILKYALFADREAGDVLSVGLAVVAPTGSNRLAGLDPLDGTHSTLFQPFVGYVWTTGDLFVQGFTTLDVPTDFDDVTLLFNDVAIGWYLFRTNDADRFLTGIVPTAELHVTTPLTHRGTPSVEDSTAISNIVNLTFGVNLEFFRTRRLALGVGIPVSGPRPFDYELLAQFRLRF